MHPKVSLLVPMRNEAGYIEQCLASIFAQDYPAERLEIWVLDGQSTDGSWRIVEQFFEGRPNCHLLPNPKIIQAAGWNLGIAHSTGEIIGIVSAHSVLAPDYVSKCVHYLTTTDACWVGGMQRSVSDTVVGQAITLAMGSRFGIGNARYRYLEKAAYVDIAWPGMFHREVVEQVGGFDEGFVKNQDDELLFRVRQAGGRVLLTPDIRTTYFGRSTLRGLFQQYFGYGFWRVRTVQKHRQIASWRHIVPALFCTGLALTLILGALVPTLAWFGISILLLYVASVLAVSPATTGRQNLQCLPFLPLAFACLHFGYGLGTLAGLWHFVVRKAWRNRLVFRE